MSKPEELAEIDSYMIETMSLKNYLKYLFLTLKGRGHGDQVKITFLIDLNLDQKFYVLFKKLIY